MFLTILYKTLVSLFYTFFNAIEKKSYSGLKDVGGGDLPPI